MLKVTEETALKHFLNGNSNKEIAKLMNVSIETAIGYFNRAKKKLNCQSNHALKSAYERLKNEKF
jgi:DNA-binding CsgD family transcriptional regulator